MKVKFKELMSAIEFIRNNLKQEDIQIESCDRTSTVEFSGYDKDDNLIKEFESLRQASRELNIDTGSISKCCRGICYKYVNGFIFKYL